MKKRMIVLAVAGVFAGTAAVAAEKPSASVNGFIDNVYTVVDDFGEDLGTDADGDSANATEGDFSTSGELDFAASMGSVSARIDLDVGNGVSTEQMFGNWQINDMFGLMVGRFSNPLGFEAEDAPDLYQTSHSLIWGILDNQTADYTGNNVQGAALNFGVGPVKITAGLLNELQGVDEANSFLGVVSGSPVEGLDLELGILTQEDNTAANGGSLETLTDFNAAYSLNAANLPVKVWLDWLSAGEGIDSAYSIGGMVGVASNVSLTLRFDSVSYDVDGVDDSEATTLAATWTPVENLALLLEWRNDSFQAGNTFAESIAGVSGGTAEDDGDRVTLEGIFTF